MIYMLDLTFAWPNFPASVTAQALKMDSQTVRLLLQQGVVSWGCAYKRTPKSQHYSYLIYPKKFYEETGFVYKGGAES